MLGWVSVLLLIVVDLSGAYELFWTVGVSGCYDCYDLCWCFLFFSLSLIKAL